MYQELHVGNEVRCVRETLKNKWDVDLVGKHGIITEVSTGDPKRYYVLFDGEDMVRCMYPEEVQECESALRKMKFKVGDVVEIISDTWYNGKYQGCIATITKVSREEDLDTYTLDINEDACWFDGELELVGKKADLINDVQFIRYGSDVIVGNNENHVIKDWNQGEPITLKTFKDWAREVID